MSSWISGNYKIKGDLLKRSRPKSHCFVLLWESCTYIQYGVKKVSVIAAIVTLK